MATTNSDDSNTTTESTEEKRTATNSYRFSGETKTYKAYKPSEWTSPQEILFSSFTITETDLRVKTAEFESPYYIDLTKGRTCVWIQRKYGDNFGGVILKATRDDTNGMYTYTCQDWNRLLTNKVYVVLNGEWEVYKIITKMLVQCGVSTDGLDDKESYDGIIEEVPLDDDPSETNTSDSATSSSSSDVKSDDNNSSSKNTEKETKLKKGNPFRQTPQGLYDKISARDFILALVMKEGVNIDIFFDENGVLHFKKYEKDTWLKERWYFVDTEIYDAQLSFDITDIITQVVVKHVDALDGNATLYTSEKMLGVNIAAFFGVMGTVIDNPTKSSGSGATASGDGFTASGKPSAGRCCARNNGGVMPPYKTVTRTYRNYCPMCKASNCLADTPKNPSRNRVVEGEISCTKCGADYCICCGAEKNGTCRSNLQKVGSSTAVSTSTESSNNYKSASTGGSVSSTQSDSSDTDSSLTDGSTAVVENYAKNKIAARIAFSESIRKWFSFSLKLPGEYKNLHTNSFCMFMMSETFMLENLPVIGKKLNGKFTRYVGYEKNRFYIEKVVTTCNEGVGLSTELTCNPFASDYSTFAKTQVQAEETLASALGSGGISGDAVGIGNALASKYTFCGRTMGNSKGSESYSTMKKVGCGSCWAWSGALYTELKRAGYTVRVIQYPTSAAANHRSVQIQQNGSWEDYPYRQTNIPKHAWSYSHKSFTVALDENGKGATNIL